MLLAFDRKLSWPSKFTMRNMHFAVYSLQFTVYEDSGHFTGIDPNNPTKAAVDAADEEMIDANIIMIE